MLQYMHVMVATNRGLQGVRSGRIPSRRAASSVRSQMRVESDENTIEGCDRWCRSISYARSQESKMLIIDGG